MISILFCPFCLLSVIFLWFDWLMLRIFLRFLSVIFWLTMRFFTWRKSRFISIFLYSQVINFTISFLHFKWLFVRAKAYFLILLFFETALWIFCFSFYSNVLNVILTEYLVKMKSLFMDTRVIVWVIWLHFYLWWTFSF